MDEKLRARLQALARFAPIFAAPGFRFATWHAPGADAKGVLTMPQCNYGEEAMAFVRMAYQHHWVLPGFDWGTWTATPEAEGLRAPPAIAKASADQLGKLLTMLIRQDRFSEGALEASFKEGFLTAITARAGALLDAG